MNSMKSATFKTFETFLAIKGNQASIAHVYKFDSSQATGWLANELTKWPLVQSGHELETNETYFKVVCGPGPSLGLWGLWLLCQLVFFGQRLSRDGIPGPLLVVLRKRAESLPRFVQQQPQPLGLEERGSDHLHDGSPFFLRY